MGTKKQLHWIFPYLLKLLPVAKVKTYVYGVAAKRKLASGVRGFKSSPLPGRDGSQVEYCVGDAGMLTTKRHRIP